MKKEIVNKEKTVTSEINQVEKSSDSLLMKEVKVHGGKCYEFFKRFFDIVLSGLVLLIFGWFILLLMLIKWLEDANGKAFVLDIKLATKDTKDKYKQVAKDGKVYEVHLLPDPEGKKDPTVHGAIYTSTRIGKNGKPFKFHKIRSMCKGAEAMKAQLLSYGINEADDPAFKLKNDPRITRFGHFIRKTSLDELPQIWDIFIGSLAIVGPRPPIPCEVDEYTSYQRHRLDVKGGLLCLWQIQKHRHQLSFDEWVKLDIEYIEHRSLWLDFKIIVMGFWRVLTDRSGE